MANGLEIIRDERGQMVTPQRRSLTSYRDELRWREKLEEARERGDEQAEFDALQMITSIYMASEPPVAPEPSLWQRFGHGSTMLGAGIGQLIPEPIGGLTEEEQASIASGREIYERARPPGIDWPSLAGTTAASAPMMLLPQFGVSSFVPRTIAGAGAGGIAGGSMFAESPEERLWNIGAGATGGAAGAAALPPIVALSSNAARAALPRRMPPDPTQIVPRAAAFGYVGDAAPARGRITRDPNQITDEENLATLPGGEGLAARYREQAAQDQANIDRFVEQQGGPLAPGAAGQDIIQGTQRRASDWQTDVTNEYKRVRAARPDAVYEGARLKDAFADILKVRRNSIPADVRRRINELSEGDVDPIELENLDKLITEYQGGPEPATNTALRLLKNRLRDEIDAFADDYGQAYRGAVGEAGRRFEAIGPDTGLTGKIVARGGQGDVDPIKIIPKVKSAGINELETLRNFISAEQPQAWQAVRRGIITEIAERATKGGFKQSQYKSALANAGGRERLEVLFGKEGADELYDFGSVVADLYGPVRGARPNVSGTEVMRQRLMDSMMSRLLRLVPGLRDIAEGAAESAAARRNARRAAYALDPSARPPIEFMPQGLAMGSARAAGNLLSIPAAMAADPLRQRFSR